MVINRSSKLETTNVRNFLLLTPLPDNGYYDKRIPWQQLLGIMTTVPYDDQQIKHIKNDKFTKFHASRTIVGNGCYDK